MRRILVVLIGIVTSAIATQAMPAVDAYHGQLTAAASRLARTDAAIAAEAARAGLPVRDYLARLLISPDPVQRERGERNVAAEARLARLTESLSALDSATGLNRIAAVVEGFDLDVASSAVGSFELALPRGGDDTVLGLIGLAVGLCLGFLLVRL